MGNARPVYALKQVAKILVAVIDGNHNVYHFPVFSRHAPVMHCLDTLEVFCETEPFGTGSIGDIRLTRLGCCRASRRNADKAFLVETVAGLILKLYRQLNGRGNAKTRNEPTGKGLFRPQLLCDILTSGINNPRLVHKLARSSVKAKPSVRPGGLPVIAPPSNVEQAGALIPIKEIDNEMTVATNIIRAVAQMLIRFLQMVHDKRTSTPIQTALHTINESHALVIFAARSTHPMGQGWDCWNGPIPRTPDALQ